MAITLGKAGSGAPTVAGDNIISADLVEEADVIEITSRSTSSDGNPAYREYQVGLTSETWEIECYDPTGVLTSLQAQLTSGSYGVMSVAENVNLDGPVTYTLSLRKG
jgi:hypothetical protein